MDPFSIVLGAVTLLDASGKCVKGISGLIKQYKNAPGEVLALNNEIESFRPVLAQLEDAGKQICSTSALQRIDKLLTEAKLKFDDIQLLLGLFEQKAAKGKLSLFKALRENKELSGELKNGLRKLNEDLQTILIAETSVSASRIETSLESLSVSLSLKQARLLADNKQNFDYVRDAFSQQSTQISFLLQEQAGQADCLSNVVETQNQIMVNQNQMLSILATLPSSQSATTQLDQVDFSQKNSSSNGTMPSNEGNYVTMSVTRMSRPRCKRPCGCSCHQKSFFQTPDALQRVFGGFSIGYNGTLLPYARSCNIKSCKGSRTTISSNFYFPRWWSDKIIRSSLYFGASVFQIAVKKVFQEDTKIFVGALRSEFTMGQLMQDHRRTFFDLIRAGEFDFSDQIIHSGTQSTILARLIRDQELDGHLKRYDNHFEFVRDLVNLNPDFDSDCFEDGTPVLATLGLKWFDEAYILAPELLRLDDNLGFPTLFDDMGLTPWHVMALKNDVQVTADILEERYSLKQPDRRLRTPLHWACRYLHVEAIRELVRLGADINALDDYSLTPLHHLLTTALQNARQCSHKSLDQMEEIDCSCARDILEVVTLFYNTGLDLCLLDNGSYNRETILSSGIWTSHIGMQLFRRLCDLGIDLNRRNELGCIDIFDGYTIMTHEHHVKVFAAAVTRGAIYTEPDCRGRTVLFKVALHIRSRLLSLGDCVDDARVQRWYENEGNPMKRMLHALKDISLPLMDTHFRRPKDNLTVREYFQKKIDIVSQTFEDMCGGDELLLQKCFMPWKGVCRYYRDIFFSVLDEIDREHDAYLRTVAATKAKEKKETEMPIRISDSLMEKLKLEMGGDYVYVEDPESSEDSEEEFEDAVEF